MFFNYGYEKKIHRHILYFVTIKFINLFGLPSYLVEFSHSELNTCPNGMFRVVIRLKINSKEVEGGSDGKLCFSEMERGRVQNDYMERIMNEEND